MAIHWYWELGTCPLRDRGHDSKCTRSTTSSSPRVVLSTLMVSGARPAMSCHNHQSVGRTRDADARRGRDAWLRTPPGGRVATGAACGSRIASNDMSSCMGSSRVRICAGIVAGTKSSASMSRGASLGCDETPSRRAQPAQSRADPSTVQHVWHAAATRGAGAPR